MPDRRLSCVCALAMLLAGSAVPVFAQSGDLPRWARVSFFAQGSSMTPTDGGAASSYSVVTTTIAAESTRRSAGGFEYGLNLTFGQYPSSVGRGQRVSIYDAFAAGSLMNGHLFVKAGQMWLTDLGGLGAIGGGLIEYRQSRTAGHLRWRAAGFGGLEPEPLTVGYASNITKYGGYVAVDGVGAEKHVVGYVVVRNSGLTERSVVTLTNFVQAGHQFFLYQAAEVTINGGAGQVPAGLGYFFVNAHASPNDRLDLQMTYHRGQAIDFRTITEDILRGRPIPARMLDGYLFESLGGRVTVAVRKNLRVYAGYSQDKNGSTSDAINRVSFGVSSGNFLGTGLDLNVSDYRYSGGTNPSYDSWWVSVGRNLSPRVYVSGDYTSSLSIVRYVQSSGLVIETRPATKRMGGTVLVHVGRTASLLFTFDHTQDTNYTENRLLAGLTYRFQ